MPEILININDIVSSIPNILQYFIPGFIFFNIRSLNLSNQIKNNKFIVLNSIAVSYITVEMLKLVPLIPKDANWFTAIVILVILLFSYIYIRYELEDKILKLFTKGKTTNENIFYFLVTDCDNSNGNDNNIYLDGAWLRVYTKYVIYVGQIYYTEDTYVGENRYIILSSYQAYDNKFKKQLEDNSDDSRCRVMINMKDITIIEKVTGIQK